MIDWDRVAELRSEIGEEDFLEVGQLFVSEIEEKLNEMAAQNQTSADDFHYLRGSAANLGLAEFAAACADAEACARDGQSVCLATVQESYRKSLQEIGHLFEERAVS